MHVGLPKTGTTYLQHVLWRNRSALLEQDLLYPGDRPRRHFLAALDVQGSGFAGHEMPGTAGSWQQLAEEVARWPGAALLSHEMLAGVGDDVATRIVETFPGRPVHAILTVRDLSRVIPATWQERVKNGAAEPWREFVASVATGSLVASPHPFWRLQDTAAVLQTWGRRVPRERIHLVTVPPGGGDRELLHRFCRVLGVDPAGLEEPEQRTNASMGAVETALLQRLNRSVGDSMDFTVYERVVKGQLVPQRLSGRADRDAFGLAETARDWLGPEVQRIRAAVSRVGCVVEGDLDDLEPAGLGGPPAEVDPDEVPEHALLERSVEVLVAASVDLDQARRTSMQLRRELRQRHQQETSLRECLARWARHQSDSSVVMARALSARRLLLRLWARVRSRAR